MSMVTSLPIPDQGSSVDLSDVSAAEVIETVVVETIVVESQPVISSPLSGVTVPAGLSDVDDENQRLQAELQRKEAEYRNLMLKQRLKALNSELSMTRSTSNESSPNSVVASPLPVEVERSFSFNSNDGLSHNAPLLAENRELKKKIASLELTVDLSAKEIKRLLKENEDLKASNAELQHQLEAVQNSTSFGEDAVQALIAERDQAQQQAAALDKTLRETVQRFEGMPLMERLAFFHKEYNRLKSINALDGSGLSTPDLDSASETEPSASASSTRAISPKPSPSPLAATEPSNKPVAESCESLSLDDPGVDSLQPYTPALTLLKTVVPPVIRLPQRPDAIAPRPPAPGVPKYAVRAGRPVVETVARSTRAQVVEDKPPVVPPNPDGSPIILHVYRTGLQITQVYLEDLSTCAFHLEMPLPVDLSTLQAGWVVRIRRHGPDGSVDFVVRKNVNSQDLIIMEPPQSEGGRADGKATTLEKPADMWQSSRRFRGFDREEYVWRNGKDLMHGNKKVASIVKAWFKGKGEKLCTLEVYSQAQHMVDLVVATGVVMAEWEASIIV
ncbi:uncharacterized protein BJ171DRAFT_580379 [Polychytrium aggregatum]|uniref:uncharacterized protein n=1 Tax=Polychytrium aggregatum TaxID=110093 RepID=UPI0022FF2478|nr:uncharacterized protein BJ171DRAFT_580379 [Polychytrium aggregatum]KAI9205734.1 hypothetical protein BJ171DRAFT_580379 [Polychytrium aggregatum]